MKLVSLTIDARLLRSNINEKRKEKNRKINATRVPRQFFRAQFDRIFRKSTNIVYASWCTSFSAWEESQFFQEHDPRNLSRYEQCGFRAYPRTGNDHRRREKTKGKRRSRFALARGPSPSLALTRPRESSLCAPDKKWDCLNSASTPRVGPLVRKKFGEPLRQ